MQVARCVVGMTMVVTLMLPASAWSQSVNHLNLPEFDDLTAEQIQAASGLRMLFVNRSVGKNIDDGLICLGVPYDLAPNHCKRYQHAAPEFSVPESAIAWTGAYDRSRWQFASWPGTGIPPELDCESAGSGFWYHAVECFINHVDRNPGAYDVVSFQFSYLEVTDTSDIADPQTGFFGANPPSGRATVADLEALRARHPDTIFVLQTTSLARSIGTIVARDFNERLRTYAAEGGWPLLDFAAIISHDPWGNACFDNRDGVPYIIGGTVRENYPDDGVDLPAICQHYTSETNGGHLGAPSAGKIRPAKGWWILMARLAGADAPPPPPPPPPPAPPVLSPIACVVEGPRITCTATFEGDVTEAIATMTVRSHDGQSATRTVTFPVR
jgi:hypothetical protein